MVPELIGQIASFFEEDSRGAVAVYVFGSVARGDATPTSDVDVAVLFETMPTATISGPVLALEGELERRLRRPVDLVALNSASADLIHRVLRDGVLILDRDRGRRIKFEVAKRNEYFDLEPIRRAYRRTHLAGPRGTLHAAFNETQPTRRLRILY